MDSNLNCKTFGPAHKSLVLIAYMHGGSNIKSLCIEFNKQVGGSGWGI